MDHLLDFSPTRISICSSQDLKVTSVDSLQAFGEHEVSEKTKKEMLGDVWSLQRRRWEVWRSGTHERSSTRTAVSKGGDHHTQEDFQLCEICSGGSLQWSGSRSLAREILKLFRENLDFMTVVSVWFCVLSGYVPGGCAVASFPDSSISPWVLPTSFCCVTVPC